MTFNELVEAINAQLTAFATEVGNDITAASAAGSVRLNKPGGNIYGDWGTPVTGNITIDTTGWVNGGTSVVIWSGSSTPTISGATVVAQYGEITEAGTYAIYMMRVNNGVVINIPGASTGSTPPGNTPTATAPVITVTNPSAGTPSATAPVITVTDPSVSATAPVITVT